MNNIDLLINDYIKDNAYKIGGKGQIEFAIDILKGMRFNHNFDRGIFIFSGKYGEIGFWGPTGYFYKDENDPLFEPPNRLYTCLRLEDKLTNYPFAHMIPIREN